MNIHTNFVAREIMNMRILVVDDEKDLCEVLQYNLETEGYEVDTANSAEEALKMNLPSYNMMLIDVMMGEMSGFELAEILREREATSEIPIIFITALDAEEEMVKGLELGGDDYITKPLSMKEVKARIKAVLRRSTQPEGELLTCETLTLDPVGKTAILDGERLQLTKQEFELLSLFMHNPGKLFSRENLLNRCWPAGVVVTDRTVDVHIARLRKKIGKYGNYIKARFGYGYTFEK